MTSDPLFGRGRIEQHYGEDRDRLVWERRLALVHAERSGDGGGDEEQDDEHVLELSDQTPPAAVATSDAVIGTRTRLLKESMSRE